MPNAETSRPAVQRRGEELRRHILYVAKDMFLETGYQRVSMDAVAAQASTSKRSVYAHFAGKDALFAAVLDLVRELYLGRLGTPGDYAEAPEEAVTLFCARFRQLMTWEPQVRTCRLSITEAERLPESSRAYFDAMFATSYERLGDYLVEQRELPASAGRALAEDLLGRIVLPVLVRMLLGVDEPVGQTPDASALGTVPDLDRIRGTVAAALAERRSK